MNKSIVDLIIEIQSIRNYFLRNSKDNVKFEPEYQTANRILEIINNQAELKEEDCCLIIETYNQCLVTNHYNGSGWSNFEFDLFLLLRKYGFNVKLETSGELRLE